MANRPKTREVRVRIREVPHMVLTTDVLGNPAVTQHSGYGPGMPQIHPDLVAPDAAPDSEERKRAEEDYQKGQLITVFEDDYIRLMNHGCVMDPEDVDDMIVEAEDEIIDVSEATVEKLEEWIREEKPSANKVVEASGGDPENAKKLLEAESRAHDGEPRQSAVKGLTAVVSRG